MKIYRDITDLIGGTPLVALSGFAKSRGLHARVLAKLEAFNPAGSAKDRVALELIRSAESRGQLTAGGVIVEPTSGNTGIGLAAIAVPRGYRVILTMPETMSVERRRLLAAYGAEIVLTDGKLGMQGAIEEAERIAAQYENSYIPGQFTNPSNPAVHRKTTGPEIWADTDGEIDVFIASVGTGGTITGAGQYLKAQKNQIEIVAVEPSASPVLSGGTPGPHQIQGIGAGFIPEILDSTIYDRIMRITENDAYQAGRDAAKTEGLLVGVSSGAVLHAAAMLAAEAAYRDKCIVALLPDGGEKYLSTPMHNAQ